MPHFKAAEELLASNREKVKAGVMAEVEALQAQAGVASRIEQILLAQKTVEDQEDQLRRLLSQSEWNLTQTTPIIPMDEPIQYRSEIALQTTIDHALEQRPDVLQAKKQINNSEVQTQFAKNQLLPDLSFQGGLGLAGLGNNPGSSWNRLGSTDFYNMGGGLVLSYPLGNRSAESRYQRRMLETHQQASLLTSCPPAGHCGRQRSDTTGRHQLQTYSHQSNSSSAFRKTTQRRTRAPTTRSQHDPSRPRISTGLTSRPKAKNSVPFSTTINRSPASASSPPPPWIIIIFRSNN